MSDNFISLEGNLTSDPTLRFTQTGKAVASSRLAVNARIQVAGEWQDKTSYFDFSCWGQLAENFAATCTKGMRVRINGRIEQREYTDKDGNKRTVYEVTADSVSPSLKWATATIERNPRGEGGSAPRQTASANAAPASDDPFAADEPF